MSDCTCQMPTIYYSPEGRKGHCVCGARRAPLPVEKAITEVEPEPEKRWPDDFRGFGSNVRPRKQK